MTNGKPCEAHNIPSDICARCKGAAEERERIIGVIKLFRDDFKDAGLPSNHLTVIIDSIRNPE
jgi:hypothetical protein